ncbi:carbohydrate ABC transporter permease [Rhodovulum sp. 12E13]|uniref:carbohydrate ABC transporter permease n=1 Tax=Rhodovulum sp. 12E13 TaxID=2203891 RepID=UPI000E1507D1|nr:carbohydrate ABC transporter permease [Rhodovulum sp. 12E13]RDC74522.1 carbohydrate ABC transporter permease [Rhodovulum sp. 12E13]
MDNIAGQKSGLGIATHLATLLLVIVWIVPTVGLLVTSLRDQDAISETGWWMALQGAPLTFVVEVPVDDQQEGEGGGWLLETNVFEGESGAALPDDVVGRATVDAFGVSRLRGANLAPGETAETRDGVAVTVERDGTLIARSPEQMEGALNLPMALIAPPQITLENYAEVLTDMDAEDRAEALEQGRSLDDLLFSEEALFGPFVNTLTVSIPATVIPIVIAAFAAYALAWMDFPGRGLLIAIVVGLLVVPLQLAFVPLTIIHEWFGIGKSFLGIWLAHTGFGLPLAVYLLRNYMVGLPRDIIENARVDGATDFEIFWKIVLPLSFPALASFAIFQFLWTWNDLLVASVFLPADTESTVMTRFVVTNLLGSRGGEWHILAAAAFVMIAVPLIVFFSMQRFLVRGLLAGSVK